MKNETSFNKETASAAGSKSRRKGIQNHKTVLSALTAAAPPDQLHETMSEFWTDLYNNKLDPDIRLKILSEIALMTLKSKIDIEKSELVKDDRLLELTQKHYVSQLTTHEVENLMHELQGTKE